MKKIREFFVVWIAIAFFVSSFECSDGRSHFHFHKPRVHHKGRHISPPPVSSPISNSTSISQPPIPYPYADPPIITTNATDNSTSISLPPVSSPSAESPISSTDNSTSVSQAPIPYPYAEPPMTSNNATDNSTSISPAPASNDTDTPNFEPCVYNVRSFGAVGDGETDDTQAFRSAWKAACSSDSAILLAPSDGVFMITSSIFYGPCGPDFVFQVDGVLMPPDGPECWPKSDSNKQWLVFYKVDGMTLRGKGTIEGNGEKWWNLPCKPHRGPNGSTLPGPCDSPALIRFFMSSNLTLREISIENSPQFHVKFDGCDGVHIEDISISSPALSPNTDGIHIENTKSVSIYNSKISNGDDCISIGTGCSNVDIQNVTCGPSHGISIGSLGVHNSQACVSNISVRNAVIKNSDNGLRIKTWQGGMGSVTGITFENIYMDNVRNCIIIDQYYCLSKECRNQTSAVYVTDISYSDIKGTYDVRSPPIHFACSDSIPCTNILMSEVELLPFEGELVDDPFCWNAYGVQETLTIPPISCLQDGVPQSLEEKYEFGC